MFAATVKAREESGTEESWVEELWVEELWTGGMREKLIEGGWGAVHISCNALLLASRNRSSRFTDYQFRFDRDRGRVIVLSVDSL